MNRVPIHFVILPHTPKVSGPSLKPSMLFQTKLTAATKLPTLPPRVPQKHKPEGALVSRKDEKKKLLKPSGQQPIVGRRPLLGLGLILAAGVPPPCFASGEDLGLTSSIPEGYKFGILQDDILAYGFVYPQQTIGGKPLSLSLVRSPSRFSSVPPVSADSLQRVVSELADFKNGVIFTVSVCEPPERLRGKEPAEWSPGDVAKAILDDRATGRNSLGRRAFNGSLDQVSADTKDGKTSWLYEYATQGSPTTTDSTAQTYRHAYAVTTWRPGEAGAPYLYTLNITCPEGLWDDVAPLLAVAVTSFRFLPPTRKYIPPDVTPLLPF